MKPIGKRSLRSKEVSLGKVLFHCQQAGTQSKATQLVAALPLP